MTDDSLIASTGSTFRDSISTIGIKGKRRWLEPKKPRGKLHRWRVLTAIILLFVLFLFPMLKINGEQFVLLDIINRRFVLFGIIFWPQDFYVFALLFLLLIVFIVLFTLVYGRLWCGWTCPQTIFMEMIFRKIEYLLEGDRRKVNIKNQNFTQKAIKHFIFFVIAFIICNLLLAYIIGTDELLKIITDPPSKHLAGLLTIVIVSSIFYWIFAWFREQACTLVCPYGRLQGVLLDKHSLVVSYDNVRGEPRGKLAKSHQEKTSESRLNGDCIDCGICVQVCPTGLDIRNGTQLECINCTACIDECDYVMDKIKKPRKLIKFASYDSIINSKGYQFTKRAIVLNIIMIAILGVMGFLLASTNDIEATILHEKGTSFVKLDAENISNLYNARIINKTRREVSINLKISEIPGRIRLIGKDKIIVQPNTITSIIFFGDIPLKFVRDSRNDIYISVYHGDKHLYNISTTFLGPGRYRTFNNY